MALFILQMCVQVFREDGDSGEKRISDTPPQMKKLHDFYKEWKGTKLLTPASAKAASNLQTHIGAYGGP